MSASKTNLEKQKRRHWGPLVGISLAILVAAGLLFGYLVYSADTEDETATQIQTEEPATLPARGTPATPMDDPEPADSVETLTPPPEPEN